MTAPTNSPAAPETGTALSRRQFGLLGAAAGGLATLGAASPAVASPPAAASGAATVRRPVGFVLAHEQFRTQDLVRFAAAADSAGFGHLWASDHSQPWQQNEGNAMFPWLTLALAGQQARRVSYGTGVTCPLYRHHPSQVAQAFASLAQLTPDRVFLGVGTGEAVNELSATGQFERYQQRHDRLIEAVTLIRRLWSGHRVTFKGRYYQTNQFQLYDLPSTLPKIYIAASGPNSAYLAGRYGDGWIASAADYKKPALVAAFQSGARAAKKDPDGMPKLAETFVVVGGQSEANYAAAKWNFTVDPWSNLVYEPNPVTIQRLAEQRWPLSTVYGPWIRGSNPETHVEGVQKLLDAGLTPFIHSGQLHQEQVISWYGTHVLPHLSRKNHTYLH